VFNAYSALAGLAFKSVAWSAVLPGVLLFVLGGVLAFFLIDASNKALMSRPLPVYVRRIATLGYLIWALVLPTSFGVAGFSWGLGRGLGNLVEGPVSSTVRGAILPWIAAGDQYGNKLLGRWTLAKRLSEKEFTQVTQTAPRWLAETLFPNDKPAEWLKATGLNISPAMVSVLREGLLNAPQKHPSLFGVALRDLRTRALGEEKHHPTLKETLEAMISPEVFQNASATLQAKGRAYFLWLVIRATALSAVIAIVLLVLWRKTRPAAAVTPEASA